MRRSSLILAAAVAAAALTTATLALAQGGSYEGEIQIGPEGGAVSGDVRASVMARIRSDWAVNVAQGRSWLRNAMRQLGASSGITQAGVTAQAPSAERLSQAIAGLQSSDAAERASAACVLGGFGAAAEAAIPDLIALLEDGEPLPPQIFCGAQRPFEDEQWNPRHPQVYEPSPGEAATRALLAMGGAGIAALQQTLANGGHWRARKNAAWGLAHRGFAANGLIAAVTTDPAWQVRTQAAYAIGLRGGGGRPIVDALSSVLADAAWQVREQAALAFSQTSGRNVDIIEPLLLALRDADSRVRLAATQSLWHKADARAFDALVEILRDSDAEVRLGAARALGNRARDREVQLLLAARHDPDPRVQEGVREALRIVDTRMRGTTTNLTRVAIPYR